MSLQGKGLLWLDYNVNRILAYTHNPYSASTQGRKIAQIPFIVGNKIWDRVYPPGLKKDFF
jgi:hypothetical protein